jgi:hypothetical protein
VVVMSDDDDLTPALRAAARLTAGTEVRVGTDKVRNRFQSHPPAADRPRWLVLDLHAWHRAVGGDPVAAAAARHDLARLALGHRLGFAPGGEDDLAVTADGLLVNTGRYDRGLPATLGLDPSRVAVGPVEGFSCATGGGGGGISRSGRPVSAAAGQPGRFEPGSGRVRRPADGCPGAGAGMVAGRGHRGVG